MANIPEENKKDIAVKKVPVKGSKKAKSNRRKKTLLIVIITIAAVALLLFGAYHMILDHYLSKLNVVTEGEDLEFETEVLTGEVITDEVYETGEKNEENLPLICDSKEVFHVLLLAVDSRGNEAGRSDSMILLSVNKNTKKIVLCSFLRDILAKFPKDIDHPVAGNYDKLTHAHAYGGPELTMAVLEETFNIDVNYYAKVNFASFQKIIDALGGIQMYLTADEVAFINNGILNDDENVVSKAEVLSPVSEGVFNLNGAQALVHARNRSLGSDWARTQRQRNLLEAMAKKATGLSLGQLNNLLNTVLPMITTNMPKDRIKDIVGQAPLYLTFDMENTRIPGDGMYREENYNIIPDLEKNCADLYQRIYGIDPRENNKD